MVIAMMCHAANREWCYLHGDTSQKPWAEAEEWQRESAIAGVQYRLANPRASTDAQHNAWMADKIKDGWVFGPVKDDTEKTHPCMVPYNELPDFQQQKDKIFCAIVDALAPARTVLTYGEEMVGLSFNPSNMPEVDRLKRTAADFIDEAWTLRNASPANVRKQHFYDEAIDAAVIAQMEAVKAATWRLPN